MGKLSNKLPEHQHRYLTQRGRLREKFRAAKISYTKREMAEFSFRMFIKRDYWGVKARQWYRYM